jgi:hypothetical protein
MPARERVFFPDSPVEETGFEPLVLFGVSTTAAPARYRRSQHPSCISNPSANSISISVNGVGSEVDGGHCKSSCSPEVSSPGEHPRARPHEPLYAHLAPACDKNRPTNCIEQELEPHRLVGGYVKRLGRNA